MDTPDAVQTSSEREDTGWLFFIKNIHALLIYPRDFFSDLNRLDVGSLLCVTAWFVGVSSIIDNIDQQLLKSEMGAASALGFMVDAAETWGRFWLVAAGFGAVSAVSAWLIGGWFYNLRLSWSGAKDINARHGRIIYIFASLVGLMPHVLLVMGCTFYFRDYISVSKSDGYWPLILLVFPFWSVYVSYEGLTTRFDVVKWKAMLWFVVLPVLFYVAAYIALIWFFIAKAGVF